MSPLFEFACSKCEHMFEYILNEWTDPDPQCPKCGAHTWRQFPLPNFKVKDGTPKFHKESTK